MKEVRPDPGQIEYPVKQRNLGILETIKEEIDVDKSGYSAGTKFGIILSLRILGLEGNDA